MNLGKACAIFERINSKSFTDEEKGEAIMRVCQMPTHNGITKAAMLRVIWWLLEQCFELPEGAKGPDG